MAVRAWPADSPGLGACQARWLRPLQPPPSPAAGTPTRTRSRGSSVWGGAASSRRGGVTGAVARAAATALAVALRLAAESGSGQPGPESESLCWHDHGHSHSQSHRDGAAHLPHRPAPGPGGRCSMLALLNASSRLPVWNLTWSRTGNLNFKVPSTFESRSTSSFEPRKDLRSMNFETGQTQTCVT